MNLSTLVVEGDRKSHNIDKTVPIMKQAYHIVEIFMHFLPKTDIDENNKLVIYFKEKPDDEKTYMRDEYFRVSWYYVDKCHLQNVKKIKKEEVNEFYLKIIANTLKNIAVLNNRNENVIRNIEETAYKVKKNNFELLVEIKKLSKQSKDRCFKARVYRYINCQGEMWYVDIECKNKKIQRYNLLKHPSHSSKFDVFKKSQWDKHKFKLLDRFDKLVFSIEVDDCE